MNSFEKHGIDHLSASSLKTWRNTPAKWCIDYLAKRRGDVGPAAWAGNAVETGMMVMLRQPPGKFDFEEICARADEAFDRELDKREERFDGVEDGRARIVPMLKRIALWNPPSPLAGYQIKVEHWLDGIPVPLVGYIDFVFECSTILDLKTGAQCPSAAKPDDIRQISIYRVARNNDPARLLYVTKSKHAEYEVTDEMAKVAMVALHGDAVTLSAFLSRINTVQEALEMLPLNGEFWTVGQKTKDDYKDIKGLK